MPQLINHTARVLHLNLGPSIITIPPSEAGVTVNFDGPEERRLFDAALKSVKAKWIDTHQLEVRGDAPAPSSEDPPIEVKSSRSGRRE